LGRAIPALLGLPSQRRDVGYYPDTPLSLNHALMKDKPIRPDNGHIKTLPLVPAFSLGADTKVEYNTPLSYGLKKTPAYLKEKDQGYEYELW